MDRHPPDQEGAGPFLFAPERVHETISIVAGNASTQDEDDLEEQQDYEEGEADRRSDGTAEQESRRHCSAAGVIPGGVFWGLRGGVHACSHVY